MPVTKHIEKTIGQVNCEQKSADDWNPFASARDAVSGPTGDTACTGATKPGKRKPRGDATQLPAISSDNDSNAAIGAPEQPKFPVAALLYDQYNNPATESPLGIGSQNFEPALAKLNDQAADDFVLTIPRANCITEVHVLGEYSVGGGPASSFNVYFYTNGGGGTCRGHC